MSSGMWRCVDLALTDVSEEHIASTPIVFGSNNFCFLFQQIQDGVVDQQAFAAYVVKYVQEKNASAWKDAIDAALQNCSASVRTYP
jgi:hypothetical protein